MATTGSIKITLRLPPWELSPNKRPHWAAKAKAVKLYRSLAKFESLATGCRPMWKKAIQQTTFYFDDRHRRDKDNHTAQLKAVWDGMVDAGVMDDDVGLTHKQVEMKYDKKNPRVEIEIWGEA